MNEFDEMKRVVKCGCGSFEYYGMMHWRDGHQYCRRCIESIWNKDRAQANLPHMTAFEHYFPYYSDGRNYTIGSGVKHVR